MSKIVASAVFLMMVAQHGFVAMASEPLPAVNRWIPPEAIIVLEVTRPAPLLDLVTDDQLVAAITSSTAYQQGTDSAEFRQFLGVIRYLETTLNTDWATGLQRLFGKGVTLAVMPGNEVLLVLDAEDGQLLSQLHDIVLRFAQDEAARQGQADRVKSAEYRGITGWTLGGDEAHVILDNRLLVTNKPDLLKQVLDRSLDSGSSNLATLPAYHAASRVAGADAAARLYVNMELLKQHPPVSQALESGRNPLAELMFAGVTDALRQSTWLSLGLNVDRYSLLMEATTDAESSQASGVAAVTLPQQADVGASPLLSVPRQIAAVSLHRDLHAFYAAKDQLFPERTSGLIFFENMMGIFFSGRDLTEEVLAETTPRIRVVVAEQEYDPQIGTPRVRIPAFAVVFSLRDPENYQIVAEEAWQKALGLVNFTRGQQGLPGLIIDRLTHSGVKFTMAFFSARNIADRTTLETHHNFRPSLAMFDDYMILSSTEGLTRDLIDSLKQPSDASARKLDQAHTLLALKGAEIASILRSNREQMVRDNMVEKGTTQEEAEAEIDTLLEIVQHLAELKLEIGAHKGRPQASMRLTVQ